MKHLDVPLGRSGLACAAASLALCLPMSTLHAQTSEDASLARGAQEDSTPQQRYQTAIREAGGGLKISVEECKAAAERAACNVQARARYTEAMAAAKTLLKNPEARPLNVTGGPIRSSIMAVDIKP